jgi:hypothetical protein
MNKIENASAYVEFIISRLPKKERDKPVSVAIYE